MINDVLNALLAAAAYSGTGLVLMAVGFVLVDVLTPGRLKDLIWKDHSKNAAVLVAATFLGLGVNIFLAIMYNGEAGLTSGLVYTGVFGLLGVLMQMVSFLLLDKLSGDHLGELVKETTFNAAILVPASAQVAVSLIVGASIA
jgi:uncharacterized membrane protein YjfL (UPF0719 family)